MPIQQIEIANLILDQVNEYINDDFLQEEGIFRKSGFQREIKKIYQEARKHPKKFDLSKSGEAFLANPHNVVGLLKKSLMDEQNPLVLNEATATYLNENERETFIAQEKSLEEAKFLHNLIYLSRRIVEHEAQNKMPAKNVSIALLAPRIAALLNKDLEAAQAFVQPELEKKSSSHFDKPFHQAYPHLQLKKESTSRLEKARKSLQQKRKKIVARINKKRKAVGEALHQAVKRRKKDESGSPVSNDNPEPFVTWYDKEALLDILTEIEKEEKDVSLTLKGARKPETWPRRREGSSTRKTYQKRYEDVKREKEERDRAKPMTIKRENDFKGLKEKFEHQSPFHRNRQTPRG